MARPESQALAGYYATPTTLLGRIAALVEPVVAEQQRSYGSRSTVSVLDPCAGDGEALVTIARTIAPDAVLYGCELEVSRHKVLEENFGSYTRRVLQGDAFRISFVGPGAGVLFLNPPYDHDPEHVRLEQRWLLRFTPALRVGGVLLFLVPHYALEASADFLALHYDVHGCFRFPQEEWGFKQCVLVATRVEERMVADAKVATRVRTWVARGERLRVLPLAGPGLVAAPSSYETAFTTWKMGDVDYTALAARYRPWGVSGKSSTRAVEGMEPGQPLGDLLLRTYPLATPPRPAHIAAGISSGIFNGARIEPNDGSPLTSPLLVKGVFDREYKTVDEKTNKAGEVTALVQVQQPKLVVTALDLETHEYRTLGSGEMKSARAENLTVSGLLTHYGDSLMRVMRRQCPVLHDPVRDKRFGLPRSSRKLFKAQHHAVTALLKLLAKSPAAVLLGEIGVGKSTVALATARAKGCTRPLVLCPPHLLQSWTNEVAAVYPGAGVHVLSTIQDVQDYAALPQGGFHVAVLSREAAKLGHAWAGVEGPCPRCGAVPAGTAIEFARKRARCGHREVSPADRLAVLATEMAERLVPHAPGHHAVAHLVRGRHAERRRASAATSEAPKFRGLAPESLHEVLSLLAFSRGEHVDAAIARLLHACGDDALTASVVRALYPLRGESSYDNLAVSLALLVADDALRAELEAEGQATKKLASKYDYGDRWNLDERVKQARDSKWCKVAGLDLTWSERGPVLGGHPARSLHAACDALYSLAHAAEWRRSRECGEPLFQAVPEPRRVALSSHIARYFPRSFDFLVLDEGHEYASDTSAQSFAGHRLSGLGKPTLLMTGTIMNGYAESLFVNMWALSPAFRAEFSRDDKQRFVDRYGYRKRVVEERVDGAVVAYGSQSDRVERSERQVGNAPGVLPLFLLRHLLPVSVTLHKADLAIDLPSLTQEVCPVDPGPELAERFERLKKALAARIRSDRFKEGLAGKLWGQLAELPSYLDRATSDVGNCEAGDYEVRYPEGVLDGRLVASERGYSPDALLPKERWLLDLVDRELAEGRNVMVFAWHTKLLPRLRRLLEAHTGTKVPFLDVDKVGTAKRQEWIDKNVVRPGARVMVANPVAVQTGLNNLVHFATEVWMENPACNPIVFRQAVGRVDRIGQRLPTRVFFPVYEGTLQEQLHELLAKKVAVSVATDGLDPEQALLAAGVGESDALAALSIGRQLWSLMGQRDD